MEQTNENIENIEQVEENQEQETENTNENSNKQIYLNFNKEYYTPIHDGVRTATFATDDYGLCADDTAVAQFIEKTDESSSEPKTLLLVIENVEKVRFGRINTKQAKRVGYAHESILKIDFKNAVPTVDEDTGLYYITFHVYTQMVWLSEDCDNTKPHTWV